MRAFIKFLKSFKYAGIGIMTCVRRERNFRVHISAALTVLIFSALYGVDKLSAAVLTLNVFFVLAAEAVNTSIEAAVDLISPKKSYLAKIAKDTAAAAVLLAAICAVITAFFVFSDTARLADALSQIMRYWWAAVLYVIVCAVFVFVPFRNNKGDKI